MSPTEPSAVIPVAKPVTWVQPEDLLRHELWQSARELGPDQQDALQRIGDRWVGAGGTLPPPHVGASPELGDRRLRPLAEELLAAVAAIPRRIDPNQPDDWPSISAIIEPAAAQHVRPDSGTDLDALTGAWLGRTVGCVLGKPVEKIPRRGIEEILRGGRRWPLRTYFTADGLPSEIAARWPWNRASGPTSLIENIDGAPEDDDLNFTLMALRLLERVGAEFSSADVAQSWLLDLPAGRSFTAERLAYRNLLCGLDPPDTARTGNPYREWIGAQIRTDLYGWVGPGDPLGAARRAHRDAAVSHTRNGLYCAMALAAMGSVAVVRTPDRPGVDDVLDAGLAVVPPRSAAAAALVLGRRLATDGLAPQEAYPVLERAYPDLHWVHALNNTALVAYALAHGRGAFDTSVCAVVAGGWDTDSNGASVGGIAGALVGAAGIDPVWTRPLRDRFSSALPGEDGGAITEAAARTLALVRSFGGAPTDGGDS